MIEILLCISIGIFLGTITGLIPGIHVNLISVLLLSISPFLLQFLNPLLVSIIIIAMAVTHSFLDTIPSTFLGVAEEDTALSILPGHKMLLEGKGYEAVMLTVIGSLTGLIGALALTPILLKIVPKIYENLREHIGIILILISLFMITKEKNKLWATIIFTLSGILGILVLKLPINEPLFPLFSGLFGISMILTSLNNKIKIPKQIQTDIEIKHSLLAIPTAIITGWFASFMPGLGPAQAAVIGSQFVSLTEKGFLVLVGGLSTVNMVLSIITFYTLQKARNGAIVTVSEILQPTIQEIWIILSAVLIIGGIACMLAIKLTKIFSEIITKINYKNLNIGIILFVSLLVFIISKEIGVLILIVSTALGIIPNIKKVSRSQLMGCLLIPVIIYFI
jgi:putative membrane protein